MIRVAAGISFEHVKQCTNSAYATGSASRTIEPAAQAVTA